MPSEILVPLQLSLKDKSSTERREITFSLLIELVELNL